MIVFQCQNICFCAKTFAKINTFELEKMEKIDELPAMKFPFEAASDGHIINIQSTNNADGHDNNQSNDEFLAQILQQNFDENPVETIEQLKRLIYLLLHFKYMSVYLRKQLRNCLEKSRLQPKAKSVFLNESLSNDIDYCSELLTKWLENQQPTASSTMNKHIESIRKCENFYEKQLNNDQTTNQPSYYSLKQFHLNNSIDSGDNRQQQPQQQLSITIDFEQSNQSSLSSSMNQDDHSNQSFSTNNQSIALDTTTNDLTNDLLLVEYHCQFEGCRYRSKSLQQVTDHEEKRHLRLIHECKFDNCRETFTDITELNSHMSNVHLNYKLKREIKSFLKSLTTATDTSDQNQAKNDPKTTEESKSNESEKNDSNFECQDCGKGFAIRKYLNRHIKRMHQKKRTLDTANKEDNDDGDGGVDGDEDDCGGDGEGGGDGNGDGDAIDEIDGSPKKKKLKTTAADEPPDNSADDSTGGDGNGQNDRNDQRPKRSTRNNRKMIETYEVFECTTENCQETFTSKSKYNEHIRVKHRTDYLTCKFCDKLCPTRNSLTNHIWIMHEEGEYHCPMDNCDFMSKLRRDLLNHKKLRHHRYRKCDMCGESIMASRFQRHKTSVHKIRNFPCSWPSCLKTFPDSSALKNHVRIHLNFKRFRCTWPDCGYASEQRFTVITHIRVCHFKLPRTKKKQMELNIVNDEQLQNPYDYLETCREDICL